jgi:predicted acylesterase/phospholipase RssA
VLGLLAELKELCRTIVLIAACLGLRVPVYYIAGSSMGGLVGGVYATGRNAAEVRDVVKTINWDEVISGQVPFKDLSYRRKEDAHQYPQHLGVRTSKRSAVSVRI